jgi:two-component system phosphate regulon sensor histidine kinase PhoR
VVVLSDRTREHSAERSHADFVANVSHELRTPLASLIGFTETLLGPPRTIRRRANASSPSWPSKARG